MSTVHFISIWNTNRRRKTIIKYKKSIKAKTQNGEIIIFNDYSDFRVTVLSLGIVAILFHCQMRIQTPDFKTLHAAVGQMNDTSKSEQLIFFAATIPNAKNHTPSSALV
jgi:hypothetical protein